MKVLSDLNEKINHTTGVIDSMISQYFANRLGVKDVKVINALGHDGQLTFTQKVELFSEIARLSKIDRAKLKIYTRINNEMLLGKDIFSTDGYFSGSSCYSPFLFNVYLEDADKKTIKQKLIFAIDQLMEDVVSLTEQYVSKPQIYYNKNVGIKLPE
ncbi:MAG: hypothetical protein KDC69_05820 [Flavobacteriaceae bacterium]|nr:hypothetical protein [Flavobacteriaceae bacterium]MCB0475173.1 hypothetical protein [Flavobacteriaceae bacterium]